MFDGLVNLLELREPRPISQRAHIAHEVPARPGQIRIRSPNSANPLVSFLRARQVLRACQYFSPSGHRVLAHDFHGLQFIVRVAFKVQRAAAARTLGFAHATKERHEPSIQ